MRSDFFCRCCNKYYPTDKLGGHLSKQPYCAMCYVGKAKRAEVARYESLKAVVTSEQKSELKLKQIKTHKRAADWAYKLERAQIEREAAEYDY